MGPGDGNYDGNRYHKKPILRFGDFTDRFNANRMNRSQYALASSNRDFRSSSAGNRVYRVPRH